MQVVAHELQFLGYLEPFDQLRHSICHFLGLLFFYFVHVVIELARQSLKEKFGQFRISIFFWHFNSFQNISQSKFLFFPDFL
jgi:hypothetical protein